MGAGGGLRIDQPAEDLVVAVFWVDGKRHPVVARDDEARLQGLVLEFSPPLFALALNPFHARHPNVERVRVQRHVTRHQSATADVPPRTHAVAQEVDVNVAQ